MPGWSKLIAILWDNIHNAEFFEHKKDQEVEGFYLRVFNQVLVLYKEGSRMEHLLSSSQIWNL